MAYYSIVKMAFLPTDVAAWALTNEGEVSIYVDLDRRYPALIEVDDDSTAEAELVEKFAAILKKREDTDDVTDNHQLVEFFGTSADITAANDQFSADFESEWPDDAILLNDPNLAPHGPSTSKLAAFLANEARDLRPDEYTVYGDAIAEASGYIYAFETFAGLEVFQYAIALHTPKAKALWNDELWDDEEETV